MFAVLSVLISTLFPAARSHADLLAEIAALRQQLRDATPWGAAPRFLLHDNDGVFGQLRSGAPAGGSRGKRRYRCTLDRWLLEVLVVKGIPIPYRAPNASAHIERFMRTLKQECLRHFIFFSEAQLRRTVMEFVDYYNYVRPGRWSRSSRLGRSMLDLPCSCV